MGLRPCGSLAEWFEGEPGAGTAYGLEGLFCVIVLEGDGERISPSLESCDVHE